MSDLNTRSDWFPMRNWRELVFAGAVFGGGSIRLVMDSLNPVPAPLPNSPAYLLALFVGTVAVLLRAKNPTISLAIATVSSIFMTATGLNWIGSLLPTLVCVYHVSVRFRQRAALLRVVPAIILVTITSPLAHSTQNSPEVIPVMLALIAAMAFGRSSHGRRRYVEATLQRAQAIEENAQQEARRKLAEQRLAIARELHDVVAHHMTIINVQAGVAVEVAPRDASRAAASARHCQTAAQEALAELHTMLNVLRTDPPDTGSQRPGWEETPSGPDRDQSLARLIQDQRALGADVVATDIDLVEECAAHVRHVAYRVVQETLTNARKHSPGADCSVTVSQQSHNVRLEITNGPRALALLNPVAGSQSGLAGIKDRVTEAGGAVSWGQTVDGGFQVVATLPYQRKAA